MKRRGDPFPFEAVRDLLGLVRVIYAAAKNARAGRITLARIARIGRDLGRALDRAAKTTPGSPECDAAFELAHAATLRVGNLVDALTPAEPLIIAAQTRAIGQRVALRRKAPER